MNDARTAADTAAHEARTLRDQPDAVPASQRPPASGRTDAQMTAARLALHHEQTAAGFTADAVYLRANGQGNAAQQAAADRLDVAAATHTARGVARRAEAGL